MLRPSVRFAGCRARPRASERPPEVVARVPRSLGAPEHPEARQPDPPGVFYVDGHRKAVYRDVLVPRGPIGKLGGKILGCRELVVLHDTNGHPLLATTHQGNHHLTMCLPQMLHGTALATGQTLMQPVDAA